MDIPDAIFPHSRGEREKKSLFVFAFRPSFFAIVSLKEHFLKIFVFFLPSFALEKCFRGSFRKKKSEFHFLFIPFLVSYSSFLFRGMSFVNSLLLDMMVYNFRILTDWRIFFFS